MDILHKNYTLVLNSIWQPIGFTSLKKAIVAMYSSQDGENMAAKALDLEYPLNEDGFVDFSNPIKFIPVGIPEWNDLPVRDFDIPIHTVRKIIRAPIILITNNFSKMTFRHLRPTKRNLYNFYKGKSIWTGKTLSLNEMTVEHLTPKSLGGDDSWHNLAPAEKSINNERGNTPLEKFKYKPKYKLGEPKPTPSSVLINRANRPEWEYFLLNK
jgi:hypothetical protein